jgi:hypothetical protein
MNHDSQVEGYQEGRANGSEVEFYGAAIRDLKSSRSSLRRAT